MIAKPTWPNMAPLIRTPTTLATSLPMKCCPIGFSVFASSPLIWNLARRWRYYCGFLCSLADWLSCNIHPCFCKHIVFFFHSWSTPIMSNYPRKTKQISVTWLFLTPILVAWEILNFMSRLNVLNLRISVNAI